MASGKFISTRAISVTKTFYGNKCILKLVCHCARSRWLEICCRGYCWKIFEPIVAIAYLKNQPPEVFCKKKALLGSHLYWSLFSIMLQACNFPKRESNTGVFPVPFAKFLTASILTSLFYFCAVSSQVILFTIYEKIQLTRHN